MNDILINYFRHNAIAQLIIVKDALAVETERYLLMEANEAACQLLGIQNELSWGKDMEEIISMSEWNMTRYLHQSIVDQKSLTVLVKYHDTQLRLMISPANRETCICTVVKLDEKMNMQKLVMEQKLQIQDLEKELAKVKNTPASIALDNIELKQRVMENSKISCWIYDMKPNQFRGIANVPWNLSVEHAQVKDVIALGLLMEDSVSDFIDLHSQVAMGVDGATKKLHLNPELSTVEWMELTYTIVEQEEKPSYAVGLGKWLSK